MKINNQTVLLTTAGVLVVIVGGLWYLTHQPVPYPESESLATTTAELTATTSTGTTKNPTQNTTGGTATTPVHHTTSGTGSTAPAPAVTPKIIEFVPAAGSAGTEITVKGSGFSTVSNTITFGTTAGRHRPDGTADNVIATVASPDGKTLRFTVPSSGASGYLCDTSNHCVAISAMLLSPGKYPVTVHTKYGVSNTELFTLQ